MNGPHSPYDASELARALWALDTVAQRPDSFRSPQDIHDSIQNIDTLPPLPEIARRLLALRDDPHCNATKLAEVVELDPALSAQLIRWANSPLHTRRQRILSVKDAITVVLGFDLVFNQALALCALRTLRAPVEGLLGRRFFWRQTLAGSALIQKLVQQIPPVHRPPSDVAHLVFLLHNTGHLLLAHFFQQEFNYLVQLANANPQAPLLSVERFALGLDHALLGAWLMQAWQMPDALKITIQHHHNPYYQGQHEVLVWLTCLTDHLLGRLGIGDAAHVSLDETLLYAQLGLECTVGLDCVSQLEEGLEALEETVASLLQDG